MRGATIVIAAVLFGAAICGPSLSRASVDTPCPVPQGLALTGLALPAAKQLVAAGKPLVILTLGGAHTAGVAAGDPAATYPARLEADLIAALPGTRVTVVNEALPGGTAPEVPATIPALLAKTGARLVIWGPGTSDTTRRFGPGDFGDALKAGIEAMRSGGADLILLDTLFVPSPMRMARIAPYRTRLIDAAAANHVPLLPRHDLMRQWSTDGTLNLAARDDVERQLVARHLFSCVAQSLATPIAAALR
jgi:acyl-CoA thioesterase-1